jgi:hypothetical protein
MNKLTKNEKILQDCVTLFLIIAALLLKFKQ